MLGNERVVEGKNLRSSKVWGKKIWITFDCEFGNEEVEEVTGKGTVASVCRGEELGSYALELYGNAKLDRRTEGAVNG